MKLTKLVLEQFRNYRNLELDFDPAEPMTCIVGPNAQGKTNILESIYLLALTKSFRTSRQQEMIAWDEQYARVKGFFEVENAANPAAQNNDAGSGRPGHASRGSVEKNKDCEANTKLPSGAERPENHAGTTETLELEAFLGKPPQPQKAFKKNGVRTGAANFIGNCQVVFFHPEDLNMLYLGPDLRRAYLNVINVQVNRKYFSALRSYQKVLKQRNALLHTLAKERSRAHGASAELNVWDEQLVEHGSYLMAERSKTLHFFQELLTPTYRRISHGEETVRLDYCHTLHSLRNRWEDFCGSSADTQDLWREHLAQSLCEARARDLQALVTTVGPHRDDIEFSLNGLRLAAHASRGEYRSLLLALKLIELRFFEEQTGRNPILLLDDVFSELDPQRQNLLLEVIEGHQTIMTTTHLSDRTARTHRALGTPGAASGLRSGKYLEVTQGNIHEYTA